MCKKIRYICHFLLSRWIVLSNVCSLNLKEANNANVTINGIYTNISTCTYMYSIKNIQPDRSAGFLVIMKNVVPLYTMHINHCSTQMTCRFTSNMKTTWCDKRLILVDDTRSKTLWERYLINMCLVILTFNKFIQFLGRSTLSSIASYTSSYCSGPSLLVLSMPFDETPCDLDWSNRILTPR